MTRLFFLALLLLSRPASASDAVRGHVTSYTSPNGVQERCVAIAPMPGARYSAADKATERRYCALDLYVPDIGLCPKTFSTSPGTLVYDLSGSRYAGNSDEFERRICGRGLRAGIKVAGDPVSFKITLNAKGTSATFSTASLLYYHFANYFDTSIQIPVSVYRSMDRKAHQDRVTRRALALTAGRGANSMNRTAWEKVNQAEKQPSSYRPTDELFTADRSAVYGIFIHPEGTRYGAEVNGTRKSGWGVGQNEDFQRTAPFLALRTAEPLREAIEHARRRGAPGSGADPRQIAYWMRDLTEITLLDYLFNQQDRIGNIDYDWYWHWIENGEVKREPAHGSHPPRRLAAKQPVRLKRTWLNDNDAGGRVVYANFTKKTRMLEKQRHYHPETYRRLMALDRDFAAQGELYAYVRDSFGLSARQLQEIVSNVHEAAAMLRESCETGRLRFDLDPESFFLHGRVDPAAVDCKG